MQTSSRPGARPAKLWSTASGHLAGADAQQRLVVEPLEDLPRVIHRDAGDAHPAFGDRRLVHHLLANRRRALEQGVEQRAGGLELSREVVGTQHLAEDLRLAEDHRIERGGDREEVLDDLPVGLVVQVLVKVRRRDAVEVPEEVDHLLDAGVAVRLAADVELDPVAGGQQHRLAVGEPGPERRQRRGGAAAR